MARFQYGTGVSGIAQSMAGATAMQAGPTGILRNKKATASIRNFSALKNRAFFLTLVRAWTATLTNAERLDWIALGATRKTIDVFGNPVPLNGLGSFIRFNLPLLQAGLPFFTTPPVNFSFTALSTFTIEAKSGPQTVQLTVLGTNITATETLIIACSTTRGPGYTSTKPRPRILGRAPGPVALPFDLTANWIAYGGMLLPGTKLIAYIRVLNTLSGMYGPKFPTILGVT